MESQKISIFMVIDSGIDDLAFHITVPKDHLSKLKTEFIGKFNDGDLSVIDLDISDNNNVYWIEMTIKKASEKKFRRFLQNFCSEKKLCFDDQSITL